MLGRSMAMSRTKPVNFMGNFLLFAMVWNPKPTAKVLILKGPAWEPAGAKTLRR